MRILVFSDTHNYLEGCIKTINNIIGVDMIIHAGDHASDAEDLKKMFPDIDVRYVKGNCDISTAPAELLIEAGGKKIFVTHGHLFGVKSDSQYSKLISEAKKLGADIAVFGHTHISCCKKIDEFYLLNPGSIKYSQTFGVIEVEDGKLGADILSCNHIM